MLTGLGQGFAAALTPETLLLALLGVFLGTVTGVLPGIGPVPAMAVLLPLTLRLNTLDAMVMLGGLYYGTQYGDSMAAILVNVPSEPPAIVVARDGYPLSQSGRPGVALSVAGASSFIGAIVGLLGVVILVGPMSALASDLQPSDYAMIAALGLLLLPRIEGTGLPKGLVSIGLGLMVSTIGLDPVNGTPRFTFGVLQLTGGVELVSMAVGMFGLSVILESLVLRSSWPTLPHIKLRALLPTFEEGKRGLGGALRGAIVGLPLGLLPGPSLLLASFSAYGIESRLKKGPVVPGEGSIPAIAAAKASDDAAVGGNLVPLLTLGVAFSPVTAMLLTGLLLHGATPGPLFLSSSPALFWGIIAAMFMGNVALLVLNVPFAALFVNLLRIPAYVRASALIMIMIVGTYAVRDSITDVEVMVGFGLVGLIVPKLGLSRSLMILGLVLGPFLEDNLRRALTASNGSWAVFVERPVGVVVCVALAAVYIVVPVVRRIARQRRADGTALALPGTGGTDRSG